MIKVNRQTRERGPRLDTLGRVASGVAHELATPIQFVDHNLDYVQRSLEELIAGADGSLTSPSTPLGEILQAVCEAQAGARAAMEIIGAMRSLHHPGEMSPVTVDLNREIDSAILLTRHRVSRVAVLQDGRTPLPPLACHPGLLNQVVLNLILNAADSIEEAAWRGEIQLPGTIRLSTSVRGGCVEVQVEDNGIGIPDELRERIFESFFTTKDRDRGTGQGLSIARAIVENGHRGRLDFAVNPERGVTFSLSIPLDARQKKEGVA